MVAPKGKFLPKIGDSLIQYTLDARTAINHFPGIGRYVSNLARAMAPQLASDERLILLTDPSRSSRWQLPAQSGQVEWVETAVSPFSLSQQWHIPRLLKQIGADVYHSPYYLMPYAPGVPTVLTFYDLIPQFFPQYSSIKARLFVRLTTRLALHAASHITAISKATQRDLLAHYPVPAERVTAVPLAADPHFQRQTATEIVRVRQKYNLPDHYVLYLGSNKPHKNLLNLINGWVSLDTDATLIIAGSWNNHYPQAKEAASKTKKEIVFLGSVDEADLPGLYAAATIFVFASLYEGFGLPVIEAMACGTAVACSNTFSLPEVGGDAAAYFDPAKPQEIATIVQHLLQDDNYRDDLCKKGLIQAQKFSWKKTAVSTLQIYRQTHEANIARN